MVVINKTTTQSAAYRSRSCFSKVAHFYWPSISTLFSRPKCSLTLNFLLRITRSLYSVPSISESISSTKSFSFSVIQRSRPSSCNLFRFSNRIFYYMLKGDTLLLKSSLLAKVKGFSAYLNQYFRLLIKSPPDYFSLKTSLSLLQKN